MRLVSCGRRFAILPSVRSRHRHLPEVEKADEQTRVDRAYKHHHDIPI